MKENKRRSFFQLIGLGAVAGSALSLNPTKAFAKKSSKVKSTFKVEAHPSSVARKK